MPSDIRTRAFTCALIWAFTAVGRADAGAEPSFPQAGGVLAIHGLDTAEFPAVRMRLSVRDRSGAAVGGLSAQEFSVLEDQTPVVAALQPETTGLNLCFLLDAGLGADFSSAGGATRLELMKQALLETIQSPEFLEGRDSARVFALEPQGLTALTGPQDSIGRIPSVLANYLPAAAQSLTRPLPALSSLLDLLARERGSDGETFAVIVLYSSGLQTGDPAGIKSLAARAAAESIPIFTVYAGFSNSSVSLDMLSAFSGGGAFSFQSQNPAGVRSAAAAIGSLRHRYLLEYRSRSSRDGARVVRVGLSAPGTEAVALTGYEVRVSPPEVSILPPDGYETDARTSTPAADGNPFADSSAGEGMPIGMAVEWPDGHPRRIDNAALYANGRLQSAARFLADDLLFHWQPGADIQALGAAVVQVRVTDELGLTAASTETQVRVGGSGLANAVCGPSSRTGICSLLRSGGGTGIAWASLFGLVACAGILLVYRGRLRARTSHPIPLSFEKPAAECETIFCSARPAGKAMLADLDGLSGSPGDILPIRGTTIIGRSAPDCGVVLGGRDPASPISRRHCTLVEEDGAFLLRDEGSVNGTYLNGLRLVSGERYPLGDGDEIALARGKRGGARLQFRLASAAPAAEPESPSLWAPAPGSNHANAEKHSSFLREIEPREETNPVVRHQEGE